MALLRVPQSRSLRLGLSFYAATHGRWPAELLPAWRAGGWNSALKPYSRLTKTRGVPQARFGSLGLGVACSVWDPRRLRPRNGPNRPHQRREKLPRQRRHSRYERYYKRILDES